MAGRFTRRASVRKYALGVRHCSGSHLLQRAPTINLQKIACLPCLAKLRAGFQPHSVVTWAYKTFDIFVGMQFCLEILRKADLATVRT